MKKLFLSVLAIAGLVACVQEEVLTSAPNLNDATAIAFGDAIVDNSVRAEINDPSFTNESLQEFTVWAYVDESKGLVLKDEKVYKNPSWTYDNTQYWVKGHNYRFFAVAPRHSANVAIAALQEDGNLNNDPHVNGLGNITFTNVNGTEDLLYASLSKSTAQSIPDKVQFQFDHILSKVKFSFTNGFEAANYSVVVTDVKMYVPKVATINLNAQGDYTSDEHKWVLADGETTELSFGHIDEGKNVAKGTKAYTDNERLTIPATAAQKYKVTFKVELWSGEIKLSEANKTTYIEGCELLPGHAYNFTATLNAKNVSADGDEDGLQAIVFEAGVKDWDEGGEYDGGEIATNMVANETELAEAIAQGGLVTLANDLALTTPLKIAKGVETTIDLNGHNMSIVDDTEKSFALITNSGVLTIKGEGTMTTKANVNSGWARYSSVVSNNPGGTLTVGEGVVIEHLGGTDMAYGIDNLTNGKGTYAVTNIESGATVKSTYSAVRQFLNGVEATNELYVKSGAILESPNRAIFFQDPSTNPNTGKLVVEAGAKVTGKVHLSVTAGSTEWPVEVSVASSALQNGSQVTSSNVPAGYKVVEANGKYVVASVTSSLDELVSTLSAGGEVVLGDDFTLTAPLSIAEGVVAAIDLNGHTLSGNWHKNDGAVIKNEGTLTIVGGTISSVGNNGGSAIANYGTLTVEGATLNGAPREGDSWPAYPVNNYGDMTLTNTTVVGNQGCVALNAAGTTVINNCEFTKNYVKTSSHIFYVNHADAKVVVNGGTYNHNGFDGSLAYVNKGEVTINGGTFNAKDGGYGFAVLTAGKVIINGGNINAALQGWGGQFVVNGGIFSSKPKDNFIADGYKAVLSGGKYVVVADDVDAVATTETELKAAIAAGGSILLYEDINVSKLDLTALTNDVVIDANGKTVKTASNYGVQVKAGKNITLKNATVEMTVAGDYINYAAGFKVENGDYQGNTITLKDCEIRMCNTDWAYAVNMPASVKNLNLVIDGCTLEGAVALQCWGDNNTITATNSHFICNYTTSALYTSYCVALQGDGTNNSENNTLNISGCKFSYSGVDNFDSTIYSVSDVSGNNTITVVDCTYDNKVAAY